jgi:two-component system NtrC family sensor kinase
VKSGYQTRLLAVLLGVLTLAACALAIANYQQEGSVVFPTDGVKWTETEGGLRAYIVPSDTPGEKAGLRVGDVVTAINNRPTPSISVATRAMG